MCALSVGTCVCSARALIGGVKLLHATLLSRKSAFGFFFLSTRRHDLHQTRDGHSLGIDESVEVVERSTKLFFTKKRKVPVHAKPCTHTHTSSSRVPQNTNMCLFMDVRVRKHMPSKPSRPSRPSRPSSQATQAAHRKQNTNDRIQNENNQFWVRLKKTTAKSLVHSNIARKKGRETLDANVAGSTLCTRS